MFGGIINSLYKLQIKQFYFYYLNRIEKKWEFSATFEGAKMNEAVTTFNYDGQIKSIESVNIPMSSFEKFT